MQSIIFKILFGAILLLLFSCAPYGEKIHIVDNQSSYDIEIRYMTEGNSDIYSVIITSKNNEYLWCGKPYYDVPIAKEKDDNFLDCFTYIETIVNDTLEILADIHNKHEWDFAMLEHSDKKQENIYILEITNDDIARKQE